MPVPQIVLDGAMAFGTPNSGTVTIDGTAYIIENFTVDRGNSEAMSRDGQGNPNRQRFTADVPTATADLQLATDATPYPQFGSTFEFTVDDNYGVETWIVLPQNFTSTNGEGDIRIASLRCKASITGTVTTLP
jgi:hypothetical protein|tara:strand:+ start:1161 stop:1559 length:399 start_codon:yes stop_codon:yes gene_type:complete